MFTRYHRGGMAAQKSMLSEFAWDQRYRVSSLDDVLTPALLLYPEIVASNVERTLELLGGDANRWRVHIKTAKLGYTVRMLVEHGIRNFKCATTLELLVACRSGAGDVLFAYPAVGANVRRVREIADQFPEVRISVLAENNPQVGQWRGSRVGVFLDMNPGMDRTGIEQSHSDKVVELCRAIGDLGLEFRGLHYYDGQYGSLEQRERTAVAHAGYERLLKVVSEIERSGTGVPEVITAGTPTFPCSLAFDGKRAWERRRSGSDDFRHTRAAALDLAHNFQQAFIASVSHRGPFALFQAAILTVVIMQAAELQPQVADCAT